MNQFTFYANKPSQNYNKIDIWLLGSMLLLWGLGIFTLYICSQNFACVCEKFENKSDIITPITKRYIILEIIIIKGIILARR